MLSRATLRRKYNKIAAEYQKKNYGGNCLGISVAYVLRLDYAPDLGGLSCWNCQETLLRRFLESIGYTFIMVDISTFDKFASLTIPGEEEYIMLSTNHSVVMSGDDIIFNPNGIKQIQYPDDAIFIIKKRSE